MKHTKILWHYFQPNPVKQEKQDCSVRAICAAESIDWLEAYDLLAKKGRELYSVSDGDRTIVGLLDDLGYTKHSVKVAKGMTRPTPYTLATDIPTGVIVCRVAQHWVTIKDGEYYDTWDSGDKGVYTYWTK